MQPDQRRVWRGLAVPRFEIDGLSTLGRARRTPETNPVTSTRPSEEQHKISASDHTRGPARMQRRLSDVSFISV